MRRSQLEHAIRAACQIINAPEVIIVGSQAILGSYSEEELPAEATMSMEVDVLPIADDNEEVIRLADLIEGVAGELSPFEETHGFSIDGIDLSTAVLPEGWRDRLIKVQNENTAAPSGDPKFSGLCLEKHDLCVASRAGERLAQGEVGAEEGAANPAERKPAAPERERAPAGALSRSSEIAS